LKPPAEKKTPPDGECKEEEWGSCVGMAWEEMKKEKATEAKHWFKR